LPVWIATYRHVSVPSEFGSQPRSRSTVEIGVPTRTMPRATPPTNTEVVFDMKYTVPPKAGFASYSVTVLITPLDSRACEVAPTAGSRRGRGLPRGVPTGPQPVPPPRCAANAAAASLPATARPSMNAWPPEDCTFGAMICRSGKSRDWRRLAAQPCPRRFTTDAR
jgi:hypothetical protein